MLLDPPPLELADEEQPQLDADISHHLLTVVVAGPQSSSARAAFISSCKKTKP